jgi:hypothetical protein
MVVSEPFERVHETGSPACRARKLAIDLDAAELVVVTNPEERQGLVLLGVPAVYRDVKGTARKGRGLDQVAPRWALEAYRALAPMAKRQDPRSQAFRVMIEEFGAGPDFTRRGAAHLAEILEAVDEDEELKRAIVATSIMDPDPEAVVVLVEQWARDRARARSRA